MTSFVRQHLSVLVDSFGYSSGRLLCHSISLSHSLHPSSATHTFHRNTNIFTMIKIWSMKKENAGVDKKKPKVSAGQIRVQKGACCSFDARSWRLPLLPSSFFKKILCLLNQQFFKHRNHPHLPILFFWNSCYLDLNELELPKTMKMTFPVPEDLLNFELEISPDEGKRMK